MRQLPLTLFEEYLFHENKPGYPCRVVQELNFKGSVNREHLEQSIREIAALHPLLTALVEDRSFQRPYWSIDESRSFPIHWHHDCPSDFKPDLKSFNITKEVALEFHVIENRDRWTLLLNISHAICDGVASSLLLHDILLTYQNKFQKTHSIPAPNPERLIRRNKYGLSLRKKLALLPMQITGLILAFTLIRRKVSPFSPDPNSTSDPLLTDNSQNIVSNYLDREQFAQLQELARNRGKSVNDHCLAFLHAAIGKWRERHGVSSPNDWIRISVPKNLRSESDHTLPACNVISIAPIDRQTKGLSNRGRLLRRAHEDMAYIKKGMLSLTYLAILWIHRLRPNGIRKMSDRNICRTTAVLSNIGRIFPQSPLLDKDQKLKIENATLEKIVTTAPFRPKTHFTLFLSVYGGELCMDLNYDHHALSNSQAKELLDDFIAEIKSVLAGPSSEPKEA